MSQHQSDGAAVPVTPGALAGATVTHWATVPSLPAKPGEHPLHVIVSRIAPWPEARLAASAKVSSPRAITPGHFHVQGEVPRGAHVLLIDDTWTTGGHAQSAALALRATGAAHVSLLVVARWIKSAEDMFDHLDSPGSADT